MDGTVYEIGFGPETITITITGSAYTNTDEVHNRAFVRINDTNYYNPASLTVEAGASIYARAYGGGSLAGRAAVYFNGSNKGTTYSFTADKDITIKLSAFGSGSNYYGTVAITTQ